METVKPNEQTGTQTVEIKKHSILSNHNGNKNDMESHAFKSVLFNGCLLIENEAAKTKNYKSREQIYFFNKLLERLDFIAGLDLDLLHERVNEVYKIYIVESNSRLRSEAFDDLKNITNLLRSIENNRDLIEEIRHDVNLIDMHMMINS